MTTIQLFKQGLSKVRHTKRMILFAWSVNLVVALILAFPLRNQLDTYIQNTVMEERLLEKYDEIWAGGYRFEYQNSEITRLFDVSLFGYAPFFQHLQGVMNGAVVRATGSFLSDLIFGFKIVPSYFNLLTLLALLYAVINSFVAGGFIGAYAREYRSSFQDFLVDGAKYFGRFFRVSMMSLIFYALFFSLVMNWINNSIPAWTATEPSEATPYTYYMVRNVVFFLLLGIFMMCLDYSKIRIVVDDRLSAILAFFAGFRFAFKNFGKTAGMYLILSIIGFVLAWLYAGIEGLLSNSSYWGIFAVALVQQAYMLGYFWLKANFFASQTSLYQDAVKREHDATLAV